MPRNQHRNAAHERGVKASPRILKLHTRTEPLEPVGADITITKLEKQKVGDRLRTRFMIETMYWDINHYNAPIKRVANSADAALHFIEEAEKVVGMGRVRVSINNEANST